MSDVKDDKQTNPNPEDVKQDDKKGNDTQKTFTQEDLDRVAAERAKRAEEKFKKELDERLKKEREDWERKAQLSSEEREAEERKKREAETADRERNIILRENRAEAKELLQENEIPTDLVDFVVNEDLETTKTNITSLKEAFTKAVEKGINDKLKGQTPKEKTNGTPPTVHMGPRVL